MNRTFHARIAGYQYFLTLLLGGNAVMAPWGKHALLALVWMLLLVVIIERIIHTSYTITPDNQLILSSGRFIRKRIIPLKEITSVTLRQSMRVGRFSVLRYVLIEYGNRKYASALPVKEQEFIALLEERRSKSMDEALK